MLLQTMVKQVGRTMRVIDKKNESVNPIINIATERWKKVV